MNQNPEQLARDTIDTMLHASGWIVQSKTNLTTGVGVAVQEYQTDIGPADYRHFIETSGFVLSGKQQKHTKLNTQP